jgi:hypothetical protein
MKKIFSLTITVLIMLTVINPQYVSARASSSKISLDKAINIAKQSFNLSTDGFDFNSNYYENQNGRNLYRLEWNMKKAPGINVSVSVDADTGDILEMYRWENNNKIPSKIPKNTKKQGLNVAQELIKKLQPEKSKEVRLLEDNKNGEIYYSPDTYTYRFVRTVNGCDVVDNGMTVVLNKDTLKVINYVFTWDKGPFTDVSKAMDAEQAKKKFEEKIGLELSYKMIYDYEKKDQHAILIYSPKTTLYPIDAVTGEIIEQYFNIGMGGNYELYNMKPSRAQDSGLLTKEEQNAVDINRKLISKEQAIDVIKKYVPQVEKYTLNDASLYTNTMNKVSSWSFSWSYIDKEKNTSSYISAQVNAQNSELMGFELYGDEFYTREKVEPKYTEEQGKKIAEDFIKGLQPEKYSKVEYRKSRPNYYVEKFPANYSYLFINKENGIACPFNNFVVSVNSQTGQIVSYRMNWENVELPKAENTITMEQAYKALYEKGKFTKKYIRFFDYKTNSYNGEPQIKLAYTFDSFTGIIDANTGEFLNYDGKPVKESKKIQYTDIKGHPAENNIVILAELGVLSDESSKFNPNSKITQKEFVKMVVRSLEPNSYMNYRVNDNYEDYYRIAIERKILSEKEKRPDSPVTRQEGAKMLIRSLGIGFVAEMPDIYKVPFKDGKNIAKNYLGYAVIASKLNIIPQKNGLFNPTGQILKGEAATMIVNTMKVDVNID